MKIKILSFISGTDNFVCFPLRLQTQFYRHEKSCYSAFLLFRTSNDENLTSCFQWNIKVKNIDVMQITSYLVD